MSLISSDRRLQSQTDAAPADMRPSPALSPRSEMAGDFLFEGRFLHACPFSSDRVIDEFDDEIIHCRCFDSPEFQEVKDNRAVLMDARRTP